MDNPPQTSVTGAGSQTAQSGTASGADQARQSEFAGRQVSAVTPSPYRPEPLLPAGIARRTEIRARAAGRRNIAPGMQVAPCPAPAFVLAGGNPVAAGVDGSRIVRFRQPSGLAATTVADEGGRTLFRGLRHDLFRLEELREHNLAKLSDEELQPLLFDHIMYQPLPGAPADFAAAASVAPDIHDHAARHMAWATANAALAADPGKMKLALAGQVVNLQLFNISVLTPGQLINWHDQRQAFTWLRDQGLIELHVQAGDNRLRRVPAQVGVRQIVFSRDLERHGCYVLVGNHVLLQADASLLGEFGSAALGGDVKSKIDHMHTRAEELGEDLALLQRKHAGLARNLGPDHSECGAVRTRITGMQEERERLEHDARCLQRAGQQLKDIRKRSDFWPAAGAERNMAAARLARVACLMGETPVLSCPAGSGLIDRMAPELVTLLRGENGREP